MWRRKFAYKSNRSFSSNSKSLMIVIIYFPTEYQPYINLWFLVLLLQTTNFMMILIKCGDGKYFWEAIKKKAQVFYTKDLISSFQFGGLSYQVGILKQKEVYRFIKSTRNLNSIVITFACVFSFITTNLIRLTIFADSAFYKLTKILKNSLKVF